MRMSGRSLKGQLSGSSAGPVAKSSARRKGRQGNKFRAYAACIRYPIWDDLIPARAPSSSSSRANTILV